MVYTKAYQDNLHSLISSSLNKKLLYEVIWKEDEDNKKKKLISKKIIKKENLSSEIDRVKVEDKKNAKAKKLKLDDAHDFDEVVDDTYLANVFKEISETIRIIFC